MYICYCPLRDPNWNKNIVLYCIVLYWLRGKIVYPIKNRFFNTPLEPNDFFRTRVLLFTGLIQCRLNAWAHWTVPWDQHI